MSPTDIDSELPFVILYNIVALKHNKIFSCTEIKYFYMGEQEKKKELPKFSICMRASCDGN